MEKSNSCGQFWQGQVLNHLGMLPKPEDRGRSWFLVMLQMGFELEKYYTVLANIATFIILSDC